MYMRIFYKINQWYELKMCNVIKIYHILVKIDKNNYLFFFKNL